MGGGTKVAGDDEPVGGDSGDEDKADVGTAAADTGEFAAGNIAAGVILAAAIGVADIICSLFCGITPATESVFIPLEIMPGPSDNEAPEFEEPGVGF